MSLSGKTKCRLCGHRLFAEPLLHYENMPVSAQDLPAAAGLKREAGVALAVCQCAGCGLVQLTSEPVAYYKNVIRAAAVSTTMKDFRLKQFAEIFKKYSLGGKKVVEIGCGRGEYLSLLAQSGVEASGLENLATSVAFCRQAGLKVEQGFVDRRDQIIKNGPFAAFLILNYLEHLPDPKETLAGIGNNLVTGGLGIVEVPNFDMILRQKMFAEFVPDHLYYFTQETLNTALTMSGYEVLESRVIWHEYIISAVVRKREPLELAEFNLSRSKLEQALAEFIGRHKNVAIWGAGHQALTIMALAGLKGKVKYVVDSAPFKQGKFTPASHLPIVAPSRLTEDPVAAVIVMAGGYSDEVVELVKKMLPSKVAIAILQNDGLKMIQAKDSL